MEKHLDQILDELPDERSKIEYIEDRIKQLTDMLVSVEEIARICGSYSDPDNINNTVILNDNLNLFCGDRIVVDAISDLAFKLFVTSDGYLNRRSIMEYSRYGNSISIHRRISSSSPAGGQLYLNNDQQRISF